MKELINFNVYDVMKKLSAKRPLFHNERDFQFELAWLIKESYQCEIRLEYYYKTDVNGKRCYIDLIAFDNNYCIAFELKYKTKGLSEEIDGEIYNLKEQGARDYGCVFVLSDLKRLEDLVSNNESIINRTINKGYVIFITNDTKYKEKAFRKGSIFEEFSLTQDRIIEAKHTLGFIINKAISETSAKPFEGINFTYLNTYKVDWKEYNMLSDNAKAYYLVFEIEGGNTDDKH